MAGATGTTVLQKCLEAAVGSCFFFAPHSTTCICMYVYGVYGRIKDVCDMYDIEMAHAVGVHDGVKNDTSIRLQRWTLDNIPGPCVGQKLEVAWSQQAPLTTMQPKGENVRRSRTANTSETIADSCSYITE